MKLISNSEISQKLAIDKLIAGIEASLITGKVTFPDRNVHQIPLPDGSTGSLLVMPVWEEGKGIALKAVTFFPSNGKFDLPTIHAAAIYFDGRTGAAHGVCDADIVTARRTAAASATAAKRLVREDARNFLLIGTGQLAKDVVLAHTHVHHYEKICVWGRNAQKAQDLCDQLDCDAIAVTDLENAVRDADTISTITSASAPLVLGEWVKPGTHVDLIGSFREDMRESDDALIKSAKVFVDTIDGAMKSGDIFQPISSGAIDKSHIITDLAGLVSGQEKRQNSQDITLFKSAGSALFDFVAMSLLMEP